jgi:branched-chain amino acid transport system substrate-binding protein
MSGNGSGRGDGYERDHVISRGDDEGLTRRRLLQRGGALLASGGLLGGTGLTTAAFAKAPATTAAAGKTLQEILNLPTGKAAGKGLTINMGGDWALSGAGASYGTPAYAGAVFGAAHVKAAGGPNFKLFARDTPLETATSAGSANARQFGTLGCPVVLTSQDGGFGAAFPFYKAYKMMAFDLSAGSAEFQGVPYFYQGRNLYDSGILPTVIDFTKAVRPEVKKISLLSYPSTGTGLADTNAAIVQELQKAGYTVPTPVTVEYGATDFSTALAQLAAQKPDLIFGGLASASGTGVLLKQYLTSNIDVKFVNVDYTPDYATVAGPHDILPLEFCFDYFDASNPTNAWAAFFVNEWKQAHHGQLPNYYNALFYMGTFWYWDLARRIIAKGGDPTKQGTAYVSAFEDNPTFPSLYGKGTNYGTDVFGEVTHSLKHRTESYGQALPGGGATIYATADITGADFKLTAAGKKAPKPNQAYKL